MRHTSFDLRSALRAQAGPSAVAMIAALITAGTASAGVVSFASDTDFIAYQSGGGFTKQFGGNVRWGSGTTSGDWEYAVVDGNDIPIGAVGQAPWGGSNAHDVTFTYDAGASSATLDLSGIGSVARTVVGAPTSVFARIRDSVTVFSTLSLIEIDLAFNGVGVDYSLNLLTGDANAEYWGVEDPNLQYGFTITSDASLDGPRTSGSDPMYQFKVGIPSPATLGLFGFAGLAASRRRR